MSAQDFTNADGTTSVTPRLEDVDLLVVGTGAAGMTTAVVARKAGLNVLLIEKDALFGGTTAYSGGMIWIPHNRHANAVNARNGKTESIALARQYILGEGRGFVDPAKVDVYLAARHASGLTADSPMAA
jgi:succinate dehydrogenase/fumarate reductase flavoprotein subunit